MIKKIFLIILACLLFSACGVKNSPEYNAQTNYSSTIHLV